MQITKIKKENFRKRGRVFKKRKNKNLGVLKLKIFAKLGYTSYNILPLFLNNQRVRLQKKLFSLVLLEELGVTILFLTWLKNYSTKQY